MRRDAEERAVTHRAKVFRVFSEFVQIFNSFSTTYGSVWEDIAGKSCQLGDHAPNQRILRPLANLGSERDIRFSADDIAPFFEAGRDNFVNDLLFCAAKYNSTMESLRQFGRMKEDLITLISAAELVEIKEDGEAIGKVGEKKEYLKIKLAEVRIESFIRPTLDHMNDLMRDLLDVAEQFHHEAKAVLGEGQRVPGINPSDITRFRETFGFVISPDSAAAHGARSEESESSETK